MDPIHYKRRHYRAFANRMMNAWANFNENQKSLYLPLKKRAAFEWATPELSWLCGVERHAKQPSVTLEDGSRIHLY